MSGSRASAAGSTPFGDEAIPLYEDEAATAIASCSTAGVDGDLREPPLQLRNAVHEQRVGEIAAEVDARAGTRSRSSSSSELYPMRRDFPRLNTLLIEAYAAEPSASSSSGA